MITDSEMVEYLLITIMKSDVLTYLRVHVCACVQETDQLKQQMRSDKHSRVTRDTESEERLDEHKFEVFVSTARWVESKDLVLNQRFSCLAFLFFWHCQVVWSVCLHCQVGWVEWLGFESAI